MRGWIIFPFGANPWWICLVSVVPAILVTILIFMDQQITAVILNRKEYKLQVSRAQGWSGASRVPAADVEHCSTLCELQPGSGWAAREELALAVPVSWCVGSWRGMALARQAAVGLAVLGVSALPPALEMPLSFSLCGHPHHTSITHCRRGCGQDLVGDSGHRTLLGQANFRLQTSSGLGCIMANIRL